MSSKRSSWLPCRNMIFDRKSGIVIISTFFNIWLSDPCLHAFKGSVRPSVRPSEGLSACALYLWVFVASRVCLLLLELTILRLGHAIFDYCVKELLPLGDVTVVEVPPLPDFVLLSIDSKWMGTLQRHIDQFSKSILDRKSTPNKTNGKKNIYMYITALIYLSFDRETP